MNFRARIAVKFGIPSPAPTGRLHPKRGKQKSSRGMEKWKANDAFHFPHTPDCGEISTQLVALH